MGSLWSTLSNRRDKSRAIYTFHDCETRSRRKRPCREDNSGCGDGRYRRPARANTHAMCTMGPNTRTCVYSNVVARGCLARTALNSIRVNFSKILFKTRRLRNSCVADDNDSNAIVQERNGRGGLVSLTIRLNPLVSLRESAFKRDKYSSVREGSARRRSELDVRP